MRRSKEVRRKISKTRREGIRERLGPVSGILPSMGHCARCKRFGREPWQPAENFGIRNAKLKSGIISTRLRNECRLCERERQAERRKNPEKRKMDLKRREAWAKTEKGRRYYREWSRMNRARNGIEPRGPWLKYRHEVETRSPFVSVEPFIKWYLSLNGSAPTQEDMGPTLARAVYRALHGDHDSGDGRRMRLDTVDEIGVLVGEPLLIHTLYGGM